MRNQSQDYSKAGRCKEASIFFICNLPYLERKKYISTINVEDIVTSKHCWRRLNIHTSPSTRGSSLVFSKNLTATSPVTTPTLSESACRNSCPNRRFSSGVRFRFGAAATSQLVNTILSPPSLSPPFPTAHTRFQNSLIILSLKLSKLEQ